MTSHDIHRLLTLASHTRVVRLADGMRHLLASRGGGASRAASLERAAGRLLPLGVPALGTRAWRALQAAHAPSGVARTAGDVEIGTSLVLRPPAEGSKGVLYLSFEYNWDRLAASGRLAALAREYLFVGASSWSPTDFGAVARFTAHLDDPLFIGISHPRDVQTFARLAPAVRPSAILASDWVMPDDFAPRPRADRDIDVMMVSHFAPWKRHWMLFKALAALPPDARVVIVGRDSDGRTAETLLDEARAFGVRQQVSIFVNIPVALVRQLLERSRVFTHLSLVEGSCVAVAEALAANTPVVALEESQIGSLDYLRRSPAAGRLVPFRQLGEALREVSARTAESAARAWYVAQSGARHASRVLEAEIHDHERARGVATCRPLEPMKWDYVPTYLTGAPQHHDVSAAVARLAAVHGVHLKPFSPPPAAGFRVHHLRSDVPGVTID